MRREGDESEIGVDIWGEDAWTFIPNCWMLHRLLPRIFPHESVSFFPRLVRLHRLSLQLNISS